MQHYFRNGDPSRRPNLIVEEPKLKQKSEQAALQILYCTRTFSTAQKKGVNNTIVRSTVKTDPKMYISSHKRVFVCIYMYAYMLLTVAIPIDVQATPQLLQSIRFKSSKRTNEQPNDPSPQAMEGRTIASKETINAIHTTGRSVWRIKGS